MTSTALQITRRLDQPPTMSKKSKSKKCEGCDQSFDTLVLKTAHQSSGECRSTPCAMPVFHEWQGEIPSVRDEAGNWWCPWPDCTFGKGPEYKRFSDHSKRNHRGPSQMDDAEMVSAEFQSILKTNLEEMQKLALLRLAQEVRRGVPERFSGD